MNLERFIEVVEERLGRDLTEAERADVERFHEVNRRRIDSSPDREAALLVSQLREDDDGNAGLTFDEGSFRRAPEIDEEGRGFDRGSFSLDPEPFDPTAGISIDPQIERRLVNAASDAGIPEWQLAQTINAVVQQGSFMEGFDINAELERTAEMWEAQAIAQGPQPIGVPRGFQATKRINLDPADRKFAGGRATTENIIDSRYFEGDELGPAGMDPIAITEIQNRLVAAGLLERDEVYFGVWDPQGPSASAFKTAMGIANANGITVDDAIDDLIASLPASIKEQRARMDEIKQFQAPPFLEPDKATLSRRVKSWFRTQVGRDPTDAELAEWGGFLQAQFARAHETDVEFARGQFFQEAFPDTVVPGRSAFERATGQTPQPAQRGPGGSQVIQQVDPVARLQEALEAALGPERERLAALPDTRQNIANVFASLRTMSSLIGP